MFRYTGNNAGQLPSRESIILPENYRSHWAIQVVNRFPAVSNDVNVHRPMIIRIDDDPQSVKPEHCRHRKIVTYNLSAWIIDILNTRFVGPCGRRAVASLCGGRAHGFDLLHASSGEPVSL